MEPKEGEVTGEEKKKREGEAEDKMLHTAEADADNGTLSDSKDPFQFWYDDVHEEDDEEQEEEEKDKGGEEEDQEQEEEHKEEEEEDERRDNEEEDEELAEGGRDHVPMGDEWSRAAGLAAVLENDSDSEDEEDNDEEDEADAHEEETEDEDEDWAAYKHDAAAIDEEDEDDGYEGEQEEEQPAQPETVSAKRGRRRKGNEYTAQQACDAIRRSHRESDRRVKRRRLQQEADQRAAINGLYDAIDSLGGFVPPKLARLLLY